MKQCPKCGNSYTDDTLSFCLADGTLLAGLDEQPTVIRGADPNRTEELPSSVTEQANQPVRVTIPTSRSTGQPIPPAQPKKSRTVLWAILVAAVLLGGLVVIAAASVLGFLFYANTGSTNIANSKSSSPTPRYSPTATPDGDKSKLEDEVAKLKKKLEEAANSNSDTEVTVDEDDFGIGKTAKVNSPNDGFLALRNLPSIDIGQRIAKIPHGDEVKIVICSEQGSTIAGRSGHWCMVTYNGQTGWVFDVWLTFAGNSKN